MSAKPDPILIADNVVRRFGGLTAVDVEHLEIPRGAITALIGPNGAGKTTFFNLLTGFDKPDDRARGRSTASRIAGVPAFKVARMGRCAPSSSPRRCPAHRAREHEARRDRPARRELLPALIRPALWGSQEREITERADDLLARFKLDAKREDFAGSLSGGQRKLLEMARALMSRPDLVMLDEPMAGVNPALTQSLLDHILDLRELGMTVLFVEHDMHMVRHIADWVVVMAEGKIVAEGPPDEVMADTSGHRRLPGRPPRQSPCGDRAERGARCGRRDPRYRRR